MGEGVYLTPPHLFISLAAANAKEAEEPVAPEPNQPALEVLCGSNIFGPQFFVLIICFAPSQGSKHLALNCILFLELWRRKAESQLINITFILCQTITRVFWEANGAAYPQTTSLFFTSQQLPARCSLGNLTPPQVSSQQLSSSARLPQ